MAGKFNVPQAPADVQNDYMKKKKELEEAFAEFHKIFLNKVLEKNKSAAVKKTEMAAVDKLVNACVALENINVGEGILALTVIAIREQLTVRDRVNDLEYTLLKMQKEIELLKNGGKNEPKKS